MKNSTCPCCGQPIRAAAKPRAVARAYKPGDYKRNRGMWPPPVYEAVLSSGELVRMSFWHPAGVGPIDPTRGRRLVESVAGDALIVTARTWHGDVDHGPDCGAGPVDPATRTEWLYQALSRVRESFGQAWRNYRTAQAVAREMMHPARDPRAAHWRRVARDRLRHYRAIVRVIDREAAGLKVAA